MASVVAPSPSVPPGFTARTPDPARFSGAPRATQTRGDDHLARVVEHLERELSHREASERRLARELESARADIAERDAQIEDVCAQWERSVTQMQAARDEDVRRITERLDFVERTEVPALRAQIEQCQTRCLRAQASAESLAAKLEAAQAEARGLAADCDRRDAVAVAEAAAAARESDALLADAERRRETELAALRKRFERALREKEASFELERTRVRKNVDAVVAGAVADERLRSEATRVPRTDGGETNDDDNDATKHASELANESAGATTAVRGARLVDRDSEFERGDSMRVSEDGPADLVALLREAKETSPEESRAADPSPALAPFVPTEKRDEDRSRSAASTPEDGVEAPVVPVSRTNPAPAPEAPRVRNREEGDVFPYAASPKPRAAPPPLPVPAQIKTLAREFSVTPATGRGPTRVPSVLVPPPPPR